MKAFKITPVWCGRAYYASVCFSCAGGGGDVISSVEIFIIIIRNWSLALLILYTGCFRARKENVAIAMVS